MRRPAPAAMWLLLITLIAVEGAPQKYRVLPNGQLSVTEHGVEEAESRENASGDRGIIMRREGGISISGDGVHGQDGAALTQLNSTGVLQCGWTAFAPEDPCPAECPLLAEESWNPCHFQCVSEDQCGVLDSKATIADYKQKRCRRCIIAGCDVCSAGGKDKCHRCSVGYLLTDKGTCYSGGWYIWVFFKTVGIFFITIIALWVVELACRRPENLKGLKEGMRFRKRTRNHMPHDTPYKLGVADPEDSAGWIYPLSTNLLVTPVGGVATSLHFSFQAYVIVWATVLALGWGYWSKRYGYDLLKLGILPAHTPQQLCSVVRWGAKEQEDMFVYKFNFIVVAYIFQTASCFIFAVCQQLRFNKMDDMVTMKDFGCYVRGLPKKKGEEDVEGLYKDFLENQTGQKLVGVSVAWDMMKDDVYDEVEAALELEAAAQEKAHTELKYSGQGEPEDSDDDIYLPPGGITKMFRPIDKLAGYGKKEEEPAEVDVDRIRELLEKMETSDVCFAVFQSEADRDAAVEVSRKNRGFWWDKSVVRLELKPVEPGTVRWHGLSLGSRTRQRAQKMLVGAAIIVFCLAIWCCIFYLPYAYYVTAFTYANGNEPSVVANIVFTILVVAGNQFMYFVADAVTVWADFGFEDDREVWYNVYYVVACVINVIADMIVTGYLSYREMVGLGVHTADGKLLESLTKMHDIVESYPMQKTMGRMLFAYCFPGTFLTPFLIEPVATVLVPGIMGQLLVRNHRTCRGREAERALTFFQPMDLGRYSDHILNMSLAVMVLYLPGGFVLPMFMSMALSHVYIYVYDHWRVLRSVPAFHFSRNTVDQFGSYWMALPCALTASCAVFKGYHIYWPDLKGEALACVMIWAFLFHVFLHIYVIRRIYKLKFEHTKSELSYDKCAQHTPCTWFSSNPIHCLRSKYIWGHEPSQVYYICGKEHLQRENAEIGSHFEDKEAQKPPPPKEEQDETAPEAKAKAAPKSNRPS